MPQRKESTSHTLHKASREPCDRRSIKDLQLLIKMKRRKVSIGSARNTLLLQHKINEKNHLKKKTTSYLSNKTF